MDYDQVEEALREVGAAVSAAESQGLLSGMIAAPDKADQARWIAQVLADTEPRGEAAKNCLTVLVELYQETRGGMDDAQLDFHLLLPGDEVSLPIRAQALGRWCEGFLVGLGVSGLKQEAELAAEVREILRDLSQITRVELDPGNQEDNEEAYAELVEYVRMASLLVLEHLRPKGKKLVGRGDAESGKRTLH